jgi:hypothetical protein
MANYVLLERIELNASAASITFANIPQTGYTDLKVVVSARDSSTADAAGNLYNISFNGSTTTYTNILLYGDGASAGSASVYTRMAGEATTSATGSTANTFGNGEIYIPNYTSANYKSWSSEGVAERNATNAYAALNAGLWSTTSAITSVAISPNSGSWVANSTFSLYGLAAVGTTPAIAPKASGGNIIDYDGTYWIHTFLTSGTFTPQTGLSCDYLVVAGGGGGGRTGGGGGAGGLRSTVTATGGGGSLESALSVASGTAYTVTVGAGGAGTTSSAAGVSGSNSVFSTVTSTGGGGSGIGDTAAGQTGGSGGGGGYNLRAGGSGTANQGYAGGAGGAGNSASNTQGGGGGGAGAVGSAGTTSPNKGGNGGNGVAAAISGTSVTYAGGGGGGSWNGTDSTGGTGGGGIGRGSSAAAGNGTTNLGGGGGDAGYTSSYGTSGNGGSGIVIIRYLA